MKLLTAVTAVLLGTVFAGSAQADVTIRGGKPGLNDLTLNLFARGNLKGLNPARTAIFLAADANVAAECTSPGGTTSKAVTAEPITVAGHFVIKANRIVNGNARMRVVTRTPDLDIEGAPDCPNSNWTETITGLAFTSVSIVIRQTGFGLVLHTECTIVPPTVNGAVPPASVVCN